LPFWRIGEAELEDLYQKRAALLTGLNVIEAEIQKALDGETRRRRRRATARRARRARG
jgi:hypothetical protein